MATENSAAKKIFYFIFIFDILLNLIPTWRGSFITRYVGLDEYGNLVISVSNIFNTITFAFLLLSSGIKNSRYVGYVMALSILMLFSTAINGTYEMLIKSICFPIVMLGMFCCQQPNLSNKLLRVFLIIMILWSIIPVAYLPFAPYEHFLYMHTTDNISTLGTFCGFATHRNVYGYYAGLSLCILFMQDFKKVFKLVAVVLLVIGLFMAASRTALIGAFVSIFFNKWESISKKNRVWIIIIGLIVVEALLYYAKMFDSRIVSGESGRIELYLAFFNLVFENPIFGKGGSAMVFLDGDMNPCHNFLLQTAADYGLIALIVFIAFLWKLFSDSNLEAKTILIFLLITGLFQPYFSLKFPIQYTLVAYLLVIYYNNVANPNTTK